MSSFTIRGACLAAAIAVAATDGARAVTLARFDVAQFQANGFRFGDFNDNFFGNFDVSQGVFDLDLTEDLDLASGFFGGVGSDVAATFDSATTNLDVRFRVGADNTAADFRIVLVDNDGPGSGDEYQYAVSLAGLTPVDGFVTRSLPLNSFVFTQPAFNSTAGDGVLNFGLTQIQVQSAFDEANRLQVGVESVELVDPNSAPNPLLIEITPATYNAAAQDFTFGSFSEPGALNAVGPAFVINADPLGAGGPNGGLGFNGINVSFDANLYQLEVEARLLGNNAADQFAVILGDADGTGPGGGRAADETVFNIPTSAFNTAGFATYRIALGDGSESEFRTAFQAEPGDNLQNFGLDQLQIQANDADSLLGVEILRASIVRIRGDFNADGQVDAADYTVYRDNLGQPEANLLNGAGDAVGSVDAADLALWRANYGFGIDPPAPAPAPSAVPEASGVAAALLALAGGCASRRKA